MDFQNFNFIPKIIEAVIYAIKIITLPIVAFVIWSHNRLITIRYRRGRITKHKDFEIKRTLENALRIYLIANKEYHHIVNEYSVPLVKTVKLV